MIVRPSCIEAGSQPLADVERSILDALGEQIGYWVLDRLTGAGAGSPRLRSMIGEEFALDTLGALLDLVHPEDRNRLADAIRNQVDRGTSFTGEFRLQGRDTQDLEVRIGGRAISVDSLGDPSPLLVLTFEEVAGPQPADSEPVRDRAEPVASQTGAFDEIEGCELAEIESDDLRSFYISLVENIPYALFRKDMKGRFTFGNRQFCKQLRIELTDLIGKTDYDLWLPELARKYREDDRRTLEQGTVLDVEEDHRDPSDPDRRQIVHTIKCPIRDANGRLIGIQGMFSDITERRKAAEQLVYQATHDSLTGLPNRDLFQERLEGHLTEAATRSSLLAVLLVDLDRFKEINDTFGHHYGDRVLRELGPRFQAVLETTDTVARLGGDEFGILLPGAGRNRAARIAEQLLDRIGEPMIVGGHRLDVGASIGIALCPEHGSSRISLVQRADVAMYAAKRTQSGHAFFSTDQSSYSPDRLALLVDLRRAVGDKQFLLHYQPKIDLKTRLPRGAEALIRWQHPREGLIPPGRFIPLAEQTGLIRSVDLWAASAALTACRDWPESAGTGLTVAVNLAAPVLQDPDLVNQFARMLELSHVAPNRLIVEVTESAMMADPVVARKSLERLHEMGVAIAIDDFGTGYSSLAYLKDLPIDEVKIDQSFIREMAHNDRNASIVRAVVDLGHNLGLLVTAEGVEDARTLQILDDLGCDFAQGYQISRPLPPTEFDAWLRNAFSRPKPE